MSDARPHLPPLTLDEALAHERRLLAILEQRRALEVEAAALLASLRERGGLYWMGCASIAEFGERRGLAADEARGLTDLGVAMRAHPLLEETVRSGQVPVRAGCTISRVLAHPELQRPDDDWIGWAMLEPTKRLARRVRRRIEEVRAGGAPVVPLQLFVTSEARDQFDRAHEIASQKMGRALTHGQTFACVVDHYLDSFDEDRVEPGARRLPDTARVNGRYVPRAVRRAIYARQGRTCAVPFCEHTLFLEKAHVIAHARGGSREVDNLLLLCSEHHDMFDRGIIRLLGTGRSRYFADRLGRMLGEHIRGDLNDEPGCRASRRPPPAGVGRGDAPTRATLVDRDPGRAQQVGTEAAVDPPRAPAADPAWSAEGRPRRHAPPPAHDEGRPEVPDAAPAEHRLGERPREPDGLSDEAHLREHEPPRSAAG